jgi:hypothetical protein
VSQYPITDDGRRLADAHEAARREGAVGRWIAPALGGGGTDGTVYDTREDAVKHGGSLVFYVQIQPGPMPPADATALLEIHRSAHAAGFDFTDPAQQPMRPTSGPLPTNRAARRLAARGFHLPSGMRVSHGRRRRG